MLHLVVDRDTEGVTPSGMNCRSRILAIYEEADFLSTASVVACAVGDIQIICNNISSTGKFLVHWSVGLAVMVMSGSNISHIPGRNLLQC